MCSYFLLLPCLTMGSIIHLIHVQDDVIMRSIKRQLPGLLPPLSPGAEPEDPAAACNCRKVGRGGGWLPGSEIVCSLLACRFSLYLVLPILSE